jgi:hypothetical protein
VTGTASALVGQAGAGHASAKGTIANQHILLFRSRWLPIASDKTAI